MNYPLLEATDPTTCLSGKMSRISRITANIFRKHIKEYGLSNSQMSLLFVLSKRRDLTQKELCDILFMEKSTLNRNLKRLVDQKYVTKKDFPALNITETGKAHLEKAIPAWRKAMKEIRSLLLADGEEAVDTILTKLKQSQL
ncbi:DNA-binding transcriptional regulator, MarR family [Ekhidna lutea]|uniref:DNA-binding transcriptional regulator, MarR family n=1 Tax=Ekhidna lutea TaxID=447679 RepID=A0A239HLW2_EKHLU|nr:MarR family transcriptional regulator [Ekhidna lutea]SNS82111.1 DNA-binding transcriptional regulator, MarR family [Ekhidna lutea]